MKIEVVEQLLDDAGIRGRNGVLGSGRGGALPVAELLLRLFQALYREIDRLAVVRHEHRQPQHFARPLAAAELLRLEQVVHGDEVAEALAHLLALDLQEAVVEPVVGHHLRAVGAARLGDLVLMVREDQVEAAGMDVEHRPEIALAHRGALDVPAGAPPAPRRLPAGLLGRGLLPEDEIGRVPLVGVDGDARAGDVVREVAAAELAIVGHGIDREQHLAGRLVGVLAADQLGDERLHALDVVGGTRLVRGLERAEGLHVLEILLGRLLGDLADRFVERQAGIVAGGAGVDLVVDVRDVAHIGNVPGAVEVAQQAEQQVEDDHRPGVADMGVVVDGGAAHVHAHVIGIEGDEILPGPGQRVVEAQYRRLAQSLFPSRTRSGSRSGFFGSREFGMKRTAPPAMPSG